MPRLLAAALAAVCALALAACGERDEPTGRGSTQQLDVELDYLPNADHAGLFAAQEAGEFSKASLSVKLRTPSDPSAPLKLLQAGRVDLAISYEPELLLARAKGAKLVSVGALVQKPLTSVISLGKDPITDPKQLEGKKIGTAGIPYQDAYLKTILKRAGVKDGSVRKINVGFNLTPAMVSKKVDATLGAFWNVEGVELDVRKREPKILKVDRLGVPTYDELIIVAREQDVRERGEVIRRFLRAAAIGHEAVRDNPAVGVDALMKASPDFKRSTLLRQVRATVPVFFPEQRKRPFGYHDRFEWRRYARWMDENDLLDRPVESERAFTNEFLPGEGV